MLCSYLSSALAQLPDYHLQLFDYTTGILPGGINALIKDKNSVLWLQYEDRVQRFDGQQTQTFRPDPFLQHIYCDSNGRVWVIAKENVFLFSEKSGTFKNITVNKKQEHLLLGSVIELPGNQTCLISDHGLYKFDEKSQFFDRVEDQPFFNHVLLPDACAVWGNKLFVHNDRYLFRYDVKTHQVDSMSAIFYMEYTQLQKTVY